MPCRSYESDYPTPADCSEVEEQLEKTKQVADHVTSLLCAVLTIREKSGSFIDMDIYEVDGLDEWWETHKKADRLATRETRIRKRLNKGFDDIDIIQIMDIIREEYEKH